MGHASKAELRDMRRVEVNFQYHAPGRGRGRREEDRTTRDVDISTLPRDEQAYFRIQQAQREQASRQIGNIIIPPVRPRANGNFPPLSPGSAPESSTAPTRRVVDNFPPLIARPSAPPPQTTSAPPSISTRPPPLPPTPTPSALPPDVATRHSKVLEKAGQLLNNDADKLAQFKSQVSSFRHSDSTATDLIDRLWDIFNAKLDEFGKLITSTADLFDYDAKSKRTELLGAWNDWKIQMQEDNSAAWNGFLPQQGQRSRILALKSSAKGRQTASTQSVWNRIEAVAASRPVASTSTASVTQRLGAMNLSSNAAARGSVPWTSSTPRTASPRPMPVVRQVQPSVRPQQTVRMDEFPSLPTVKSRERVVLNAAAGPARPVASWGADSRSTPTNDLPAAETAEVARVKGKKKGKTVLFHVG